MVKGPFGEYCMHLHLLLFFSCWKACGAKSIIINQPCDRSFIWLHISIVMAAFRAVAIVIMHSYRFRRSSPVASALIITYIAINTYSYVEMLQSVFFFVQNIRYMWIMLNKCHFGVPYDHSFIMIIMNTGLHYCYWFHALLLLLLLLVFWRTRATLTWSEYLYIHELLLLLLSDGKAWANKPMQHLFRSLWFYHHYVLLRYSHFIFFLCSDI